jgi:hypothetical protein
VSREKFFWAGRRMVDFIKYEMLVFSNTRIIVQLLQYPLGPMATTFQQLQLLCCNLLHKGVERGMYPKNIGVLILGSLLKTHSTTEYLFLSFPMAKQFHGVLYM